jgi:hypothetical protein
VLRHPDRRDVEASRAFLDLLQEDDVKTKLSDKVTRKASLWKTISRRMTDFGYNMGDDPVKKVENKYRNLEKSYKEFLDNANTTGKRS